MERINVLPRDLKPGDRLDRLDSGMGFVHVTVSKVVPISHPGTTGTSAYKVYLAEHDALPDNQKPWKENKHLSPFVLQPRSRITVEREV